MTVLFAIYLPAFSRNANPTHLPGHNSTGMRCHADFRGAALARGTSCGAYFHRFRVGSKLEKRKILALSFRVWVMDALGFATRRESVISVAGRATYCVWQPSIFCDSWIWFLISLQKQREDLFTASEEMSRVCCVT